MTTLMLVGIVWTGTGLIAVALHKPWARWSSRHTLARHLPGGDPAPEQHTPKGYAKTILSFGATYTVIGVILLIVGFAIR